MTKAIHSLPFVSGADQLYFWEQNDLAEHASNSEILKALGIKVEGPVPSAESVAAAKAAASSSE